MMLDSARRLISGRAGEKIRWKFIHLLSFKVAFDIIKFGNNLSNYY